MHSVIFAGFSADAIAERIAASGSKWVFTSDEGVRGGKRLPLKNICDNAMNKDLCLNVVEKCFVFNRTGGSCNWDHHRDVKFGDLVDAQRPYCPCEWMDSEVNNRWKRNGKAMRLDDQWQLSKLTPSARPFAPNRTTSSSSTPPDPRVVPRVSYIPWVDTASTPRRHARTPSP